MIDIIVYRILKNTSHTARSAYALFLALLLVATLLIKRMIACICSILSQYAPLHWLSLPCRPSTA